MAIPGGSPELYLLEKQQPWGRGVGSGEEEEGEDLTSNYFKTATITTLTELKKSFTKEVREGMAMLHQMKNIN